MRIHGTEFSLSLSLSRSLSLCAQNPLQLQNPNTDLRNTSSNNRF